MKTPLATLLAILTVFELRAADEPARPRVIYAPTELTAMLEQMGEKVTIEGTVLSQKGNTAGTILYLLFSKDWSESITILFNVKPGSTDVTPEKLAPFIGKKVRVTGSVRKHGITYMPIKSINEIEIVGEKKAGTKD